MSRNDVTDTRDCQASANHGSRVSGVVKAMKVKGIEGEMRSALLEIAASSGEK